MNSPEESAVTDLSKLVANVLNGMLDENATAFELIRYQFHVRSVKDVIRRGSEDTSLIDQIYDLLHNLIIYLNEEIIDTSLNATPSGFADYHFQQLNKRIQLLYEVWKGMQVNEAYKAPELTNHIDACKEAMKHCYEKCKEYPRWTELSDELREFFLDEKKEEKSVIEEVQPTLFAREDGVVSSIAHEKANSEEEGKKTQFVSMAEKVLSNYRAKNPDYKTMRVLINTERKFQLEGIYCDKLINEFISVWDMAIDYETEKPEHKYLFTGLLKKIFIMMSDQRRNDFAIKLFDKYNQDSNDVLPCLENFVENFQIGFTEAVNQLPVDSNAISNNLELYEKIKAPIVWYLFISPAYTVQQLLNMCVDNKGYIPTVSRIFRTMPTLFERLVKVTPLPFEDGKKEKLLITMLHRVFMIGRTTWKSATQWEHAAMMTVSFAKERKRKEGQPERNEDKALIDPFSLVNFALSQIFESRKPAKSVEIFVKLLQRVLANNNNARMLTNYRFANSFSDEGDNVLGTPIIIQLMFDLLMEFDGQSLDVCDGAREILKSIGGRMEHDNTVFDTDTRKYLTEDNFNSAPWWIKYSIYTWYSSALQKPKRQVPSGVYKTIPEQFLDDFEQIKSEDESTVSDCYMRSLFELGLYDVDLAIDLLNYGYGVKFEQNVLEKMALALVDSYGKKMARRNGGLHIGKLISAMLKMFDPVRELAPLSSYCENYLESVKRTEHLLILFKATRIAKEKQLCASRVRTNDEKQTAYDDILSMNEVAEQLMDVFCETTKNYVDSEAKAIEEFRREADNIIFSKGCGPDQIRAMVERDEREKSLILQLTMIYLNCSHFCRLYQQVPVKLQQLMNSTLEKQFDLQKLLAKKVMDDVLTDQRKTEVVYAFAEPKDQVIVQVAKDAVQPVKASELFVSKQHNSQVPGSSGNISAENVMFNQNNGDYHEKGYNTGNRNNYRKTMYENERPSSSRVGGRNERTNSFRGNRWNPVNDTHAFNARDRDVIYKNTRHSSNNEYDRNPPRNGNSKNSYDQDTLYYDDRRTPFKPQSDRAYDDIRRYSESRDSNYENGWDNRSRRWPSESDYSHDDCENRMLDQTVRSVRQFSNREQHQNFSKPGCSNSPSTKIQEGKQSKKFGEYNKFQGNSRRPVENRKPRYPSSNYNEQEEENLANKMKLGQPAREELADAMGFNDTPPPVQKPRRGGFRNH
ncbi:unnamed protein product [Caenorhabditis brenneri]